MIARASAAAAYLKRSDPAYKWRLSLADCPNCGKSVFLSLGPNDFMTRCLRCRATITNLSLIPVIKQHCADPSTCSAYELSTYGSTLQFLQKHFGSVATSEYLLERPLGQIINGIQNQDVQRLTFPDDSFDVITSNQVFEHVPDDIQGFRECARVLKPGGALIFSVPLKTIPATKQLARLTDSGVEIFGTPEYHGSRDGGMTALTFWHHSIQDICARVGWGGFRSVDLIDVMIAPCQRHAAKVIYAIK
jgi:SAM-dependent methyltransferase